MFYNELINKMLTRFPSFIIVRATFLVMLITSLITFKPSLFVKEYCSRITSNEKKTFFGYQNTRKLSKNFDKFVLPDTSNKSSA